jgi:hypothetical protein
MIGVGVGALPATDYKPRTDSLNNKQGIIAYTQNKDMNTCLAGEFGLYEKATCANYPPSAGSYFYCETKSIYNTGALIQIAWTYDGAGVLAWRNYSQNSNAWDTQWREAYDTGHKPTPADIGAAALEHTHPGSALNPIVLGTEDLDTLVTPGVYAQNSNANTSAERHYPELQAGSLRVEEGAGPKQTYHVYNSSRIWSRAKYGETPWTPWAQEYNTQNKPTPTDIGAAPAVHGHDWGDIANRPSIVGVAVMMGTVGHGGTIPLPSNCSEVQCQWIASPASMRDGNNDMASFSVTLSGRVVSIITDGEAIQDNYANYLIVGVYPR